MNQQELFHFLSSFYTCINIPLYYLNNEKIEFFVPNVKPFLLLLKKEIPALLKLSGNIHYMIDSNNLSWGIIHLQNDKEAIVLGPVSSVMWTRQASFEITQFISNEEERKLVQNTLLQLSFYSLEKLFHFMGHIYSYIYKEDYSVLDIFKISDDIHHLPIEQLHSNATFENRENLQSHNSYAFEQKYLEMLRQGDIDALINLFQNAPDIQVGKVAQTSLRQVKNIFIAAVTLATRASIEGGLPPVEAYNLSDIYIYQMEKMEDLDSIYQLQYIMLLDFTKRVAQRKLPEQTNIMYRCTQYISSHVNEPLTVQSVAEHFNISRPYLSKRFIEELGFSMSAFIMRCKLEESRYLLKNTEKSIGEISNYLFFSSQSYFQNVFKKQYGMTPHQYRKSTKR
ncbi:MAG: helix-turn-helix domain-containing protein [Traorella sp.]